MSSTLSVWLVILYVKCWLLLTVNSLQHIITSPTNVVFLQQAFAMPSAARSESSLCEQFRWRWKPTDMSQGFWWVSAAGNFTTTFSSLPLFWRDYRIGTLPVLTSVLLIQWIQVLFWYSSLSAVIMEQSVRNILEMPVEYWIHGKFVQTNNLLIVFVGDSLGS